MAKAGKTEPGRSSRQRSQVSDGVRAAKQASKGGQSDRERESALRQRRRLRASLGGLAGLVSAGVLSAPALRRIAACGGEALGELDWRQWLQVQAELVSQGLHTGELSIETALPLMATIGRHMRDYIRETGGVDKPVAISLAAELTGEQQAKAKALGIDLSPEGDALIVH